MKETEKCKETGNGLGGKIQDTSEMADLKSQLV